MNNHPDTRVAIIGGGYAGMAAAAELAARGIPVTVFESAKQLGGRARGIVHNETQLDNGQHLLLGCYRETLRLIELVGGDVEEDFLRLPLQLDLHGHLELRAPRLPAPLHLLAALLNARGLSWSERLKAARFMLALRGLDFRLSRDMTVSELLQRDGQDADLTLKLWEPLTIAALNTPIHKASAQVLLNVLRDALNRARADSDMLLPRIDFTHLFPQRAADFVERHGGKVHLSCGVEAIVPVEDGFEILTSTVRPELVEGTNGAPVHVSTSCACAVGTNVPCSHGLPLAGATRTEECFRFSHVICAAPPTSAARLLRPIPELAGAVAQIDALEHQPIYTVYLQYPAHVTLPHAMLGLHQRVSQWLFDKGRIAGHAGLIASVISAEGLHQELRHDELARKVAQELQEEFGIADAPLWHRVIAEKRATFCCSPNLRRPPQRTALPRLLLAGDYTAGDYPATLEGAVQSGVRCAALIPPG